MIFSSATCNRVLCRLLFFALMVLLVAGGTARADGASCAYEGAKTTISAGHPTTLKRGVNLSDWWQDQQDQGLDTDDIAKLRAFGFDFVRLPVSPQWPRLADADARKEKLAQLRCDVIALLNAGLKVIVDLHPSNSFQETAAADPAQAAAKIAAVWRKLRPAIADLPASRVLIGLYNEPQDMKPAQWWRAQGVLIKKLRAVFSRNTFVATAYKGEPWELIRQKPYADKNIIYDFHFYEPMILTHHGASWLPAGSPFRKTDRITYPPKASDAAKTDDPDVRAYIAEGWDREKLAPDIDRVAVWQKHYHVHAACLEFGAYRPYVDDQSRANWLRDVRSLVAGAGMPWALWDYTGGFGLLDADGRPDRGMVKALGLRQNSAP